MDRIEYINELIDKKYTKTRKQSVIINNFYSLMTIGMICIAILLYTNYVVPAQNEKKQRIIKIEKKRIYLNERKRQIALSHKLNKEIPK